MARFLLSLLAALCLALGPAQGQAAPTPASHGCCGMEDPEGCPCPQPSPAPDAPLGKALPAPAPAVRPAEAPAPAETAVPAPAARPAFPRRARTCRGRAFRPAPRAGPPRLRLAKLRIRRE